MVTRRNCPEIGTGAGGGGRGVKAPEGWRSPRPGGLHGGLEHAEHPWELRRQVSEADREVVGMRKMLASGWSLLLEDIGGEMVTRRNCPEIGPGAGGGGRGVKAPEGWRSPRPGGFRGGLEYDEHPWELRRQVSEADRGVVRMRRMLASGWSFVLEDIGGEVVTRRICPEIGPGAGGGGRGVKAPEGWRSPRPGGFRGGLEYDEHPWELRRQVSEADRGVVRMRRMLASGWSFVLEDIGGEVVTRRICPEIGAGAGGGGRGVKAPEGWRSPRPGGLRGGLEYDEHPWELHRQVSEADRRVVEMRKILASGRSFVLEDIGSEMVTRRNRPENGAGAGGGGRGVKAPEGWRSPRPGGLRGGLEYDEHSWALRRPVNEADRGVVSMRRMLMSGWSFVLEDIGGEMVTRRNCPEIGTSAGGGGRGVKAPEGWRSPRPGGLRGGLEYDEHSWALRRPVNEADRGVVSMRRMLMSGWSFVLEDIGGEMVTRRNCPEIGTSAGGGGRGVKAQESSASPAGTGLDTGDGGVFTLIIIAQYRTSAFTAHDGDTASED